MIQTLSLCTNEALPCETCLPSDIILCVPYVITADELGFIEATLISFSKSNSCAGCVRTYNIEYDDTQLADSSVPLISCEVSGFFCKDCRTNWLEALTESVLTGWETDALGNFIQSTGYTGKFLYNSHGFQFNAVDDDSGELVFSGGTANSSAAGATMVLQGIGAGGKAEIFAAAVGTGDISFNIKHSAAQVIVNNVAGQPMWAFDSGGNLSGNGSNGGDITINRLGKTIFFKVGTNGKADTFVLNGATPVSVGNTSITAGSIVIPTLKTVGGTVGAIPHVATITPSVGFTVVGTAGDTSTYNYLVLEIS